MKFSPKLSTSLVAGAFLLAGSFALAQTATATRNKSPLGATGGQSSGEQSQLRKHIAGVTYEDRVAGNNSDGTAGQSTHDVVQRKDGSVIQADYPKSADRSLGSAHATESRNSSNSARTGKNPLYEEGGKSGSNPMYEGSKLQSAGTTGNIGLSPEAQDRKHVGKVKYEDRMVGGGNGTPGMAVNEQGSSTATARHRRKR